LAVLVYRCLNGLTPSCLAKDLQCVADLNSRRSLRSSSTSALVVPSTRLPTVGDRAFPVAAARVWNTLPAEVTSLPSLPAFKRRLKTVYCSNRAFQQLRTSLTFCLHVFTCAARTSFRFFGFLVRCSSSHFGSVPP